MNAVAVFDGGQTLVGRVVFAEIGLQARCAGDLAEDRSRLGGIKSADRLERVRALIGEVHAGAGFDETDSADGTVGDELLELAAAGVKLQLMIDGDFDLGFARGEGFEGEVVFGLDRERFFHEQGGNAGVAGGLDDFEAGIGRCADLHEIGFF